MKLDYALFNRHMGEGTLLSALLKGHLWLERSLEFALSVHLDRPNALNIDRMMFAARLNLCDALGAFDPDTIKALRAINTMRNKAAHDLDADLGEEDYESIESSLDGRVAAAYARVTPDDDWTAKDRIQVLFFTLLHTMQMATLYKEYEKKYRMELISYSARRFVRSHRPDFDPRTEEPRIRRTYALPEPPGPWDVWEGCGTYDEARVEREEELARIFAEADGTQTPEGAPLGHID